jgi:hypothetical protein
VRLGDDVSTDDWMQARDDEVARRQALEDAGYEAWAGSTASGENLQAPRPSDVAALGSVVLSADGADGGRQDSASPTVGGIDDDQPEATRTDTPATAVAPSARYVKARPGDSISSLLGTSDPGAIGRFATLNGMDGRSSNIYAGRVYALPVASQGPSQDEAALGGQLLQRDSARAAALASAASDQFSARLEAGQKSSSGASVEQRAAEVEEDGGSRRRCRRQWRPRGL